MTVRLAGLSLALMLFVSMTAAPRPQAQASAPDPVFFQSQVFPVLEAANCSGCHAASGVASATRLHFPDKDATPAQIQAFGLSLSSLVDRADVALYRAKQDGRNGVQACLRSASRSRASLRLAPRVEAARFGFGR